MLSIDEVITRLREATQICNRDLPRGSEVKATEGPLFEKILHRLNSLTVQDTYLSFSFSNFKYVRSYEAGSISGNQLLQLLVAILNDESLCNVGNGILLTVGGEYIAAIVVYCETHVELFTLPSAEVETEKRKMFSKLFDDQHVLTRRTQKKYGMYKKFYTEYKILQLRLEAQENFTKFLDNTLLQSKSLLSQSFASAFLAVLMELARTQIRRNPYCEKRASLNAVPVAACVKLAMDQQLTDSMGLLIKVFGQLNIIQDVQYTDAYVEIKAGVAMENAKKILLRTLTHDNELFEENIVLEAIEDLKAFYQL